MANKLKTSLNGRALIQKYLPLLLTATKVNGMWIVGYGHVGKDVKANMKISPAKAIEFLNEDIAEVEQVVRRMVKCKLTQNQFDALVSFVFSMGSGALKSSVMLKELNLGHYEEAAAEFRRWCFNGVRRDPELVKRREEERNIFLHGYTRGV